ncbi:MAG: hypothetical protein QOE90_2882 [Thermoplasmata archaeon]|nr:hypothetical protein [Thermoplasmata archaeon]
MGDARFTKHYDRVREAMNSIDEIERMSDDDLVQALGAASRNRDPYLANVLTTAVLNRTRRGRAVIETIGDGVCIVDRKGIVTFANPAAAKLLGWAIHELQGTYFHAIAHLHLGRHHEQRDDCPLEAALRNAPAARADESIPVVRVDDSFSRREGMPIEVACAISTIVVDGIPDASVVLFQDVSERKRAQTLLVEQTRVLESAVEKTLGELAHRDRVERRFASILAALPEGFVITDASGVITMASRATETMFGYGPGELVGELAGVLLPERFRSPEAPQAPSAGQPSPSARIEIAGRRKDGTEFPIEVTTSAFEDVEGPAQVTIIHDVGARRLREETLRHNEATFNQAQALAGVGSWELDLETGRLSWSDEMYRLCGFAPRELDPTWAGFLLIIHPEDRAALESALARAKESGDAPVTVEARVLPTEGGARSLHVRMVALPRPGGGTRVLGTARDVAVERELRDAVEHWTTRFHAVLGHLHEGIVLVGADRAVRAANAQARDHGALDAHGALSEALRSYVDRVSPKSAGGVARVALRLPAGEEVTEIVETRPLRDDLLVIVEDPSKLDAMEAKLREATTELEKRVAERTAALTRNYREMEAFSYTVSHDLQAPLRGLDFLLTVALEDHAPKDGKLRADLMRMSEEVARLRAFVKAALQLARIGVQPMDRTRVDLSQLATDLAEQMRHAFPGRLVDVTVQPGMAADADAALAKTLLENLLSNAWKYSASRSVARVEVGTVPGSPATFFVRDDGDGFDMREASRLFQPFTRLARASTKEGSGVGLASAKRVVEAHGGRIWAESAPGKGATFFFTLRTAS